MGEQIKNGILEVCVESVQSAINAKAGGADRLELCGDLIVGGVTPALELYQLIREKVNIPIHVLLRPRFGDFLYDEDELEIMVRQAKAFCEAGADALVIGCLTKEGGLDWEKMGRIIEASGGMRIHLHRAFDMCKDLDQALEEAKSHGIATILTSGGYASAMAGAGNLKRLAENAGNVELMAGAGVSADVIAALYKQTGIRAYHMSGKREDESEMIYRNPRVNMGLPQLSEYQKIVTDTDKIRSAWQAMEREGLK